MTVSILCLFLTVTWVGLQCVIVALHGPTHLLFVSPAKHGRHIGIMTLSASLPLVSSSALSHFKFQIDNF